MKMAYENENQPGVAPVQNPNPAPVVEPVAPQAPAAVQQQPAPTPQPTPAQQNDRTNEQFQKLLDSNKRLYEANELLKQEVSKRTQPQVPQAPVQQYPQYPQQQAQYPQYQQPQAQYPQVQQPSQVNVQDFVEYDQEGNPYINEKRLQSRIDEVNQMAKQAVSKVDTFIQSAEQREMQRQETEAFNSYPELNPYDQRYDTRFSNQARAVIYDSLINPQDYNGRSLSFKEAADYVKSFIPQPAPAPLPPQPAAPQPAPQSNPALDAKQQASAAPSSYNVPARAQITDEQQLQHLVKETRKGNLQALAQRIVNTDHYRRDSDGE
jgi:hypothetical protein